MSSYWKEKALVENPFFENIGQNLCASTNAIDVKFQVLNLQSLSCSSLSKQIKSKKEIEYLELET